MAYPGFELGPPRSEVRRANHCAIGAPFDDYYTFVDVPETYKRKQFLSQNSILSMHVC
jgi:hypothetical protein